MAEHTDETVIANLRETVERQAVELAELRAMVAPFRPAIAYIDELKAILKCREYNRKLKGGAT